MSRDQCPSGPQSPCCGCLRVLHRHGCARLWEMKDPASGGFHPAGRFCRLPRHDHGTCCPRRKRHPDAKHHWAALPLPALPLMKARSAAHTPPATRMCQQHILPASLHVAGQESSSAPLSFPQHHRIVIKIYAIQPSLFSVHVTRKASSGKVRFVTWVLTFQYFQPFANSLWLNRNIWLTPEAMLCVELPNS